MYSLISANHWANNWYAGDLRRHRAHYDVTVMHTIRTFWVLLSIYPYPSRLLHWHRAKRAIAQYLYSNPKDYGKYITWIRRELEINPQQSRLEQNRVHIWWTYFTLLNSHWIPWQRWVSIHLCRRCATFPVRRPRCLWSISTQHDVTRVFIWQDGVPTIGWSQIQSRLFYLDSTKT